MSDTQHEMAQAQALAEKSWIDDRLNEVRERNEQGIPLSIGDIETLLMMALDQGRALQIGLPIITDIDRLLDEKEALQQEMKRINAALKAATEELQK